MKASMRRTVKVELKGGGSGEVGGGGDDVGEGRVEPQSRDEGELKGERIALIERLME